VNLSTRDKRALAGLGAAAVGVAIFLASSGTEAQPSIVSASDSISSAERRLERVRSLAASVPGKQVVLEHAAAELAVREKGIIQAQTAAQAQAQLLDVVRRVARAQTPPVEFGTVELSQEIARLGEDYGEIQITVPFTCRIEEFVNFLADLTKQPEAIATSDMRITTQDGKEKTISVRLTVSGVVPRRLVPDKKGPATF
jgi:type II secretory pathway component PulM